MRRTRDQKKYAVSIKLAIVEIVLTVPYLWNCPSSNLHSENQSSFSSIRNHSTMSQEEETEVEIERLSPASSRREGRPVHEFLRLRPSPFSQLTSPSQEGMTIEEEDGSNDSGDDNASGEDRYEMQQGENWLRLMKKEEANSILDFTQDRQGSIGSCTPLILSLEALGTIAAPTKDCYLCIDVDEAILVVKDMRLPSSCSKRKSNDIDDSNSDDDSVCGLGLARRLPGPTQWESVPRRQMRTLESGDRLCTSLIQTSNGFQPSPDGLILEYRKTYRKDTTKMDDSSDPLHFAKNDSPVAKKYTGQTSPQDDTPASNSVKTQPLTQLSQPNFLANGVNDDTPASNSVKTQPMTQLSQPNLLSSGVKAESDEAPEDLEEKSDKKDDPMDTVSDDGSDKSVEIVVAKSNGESMGSPNVGISTMFATQPNADLSDDDTTLGDEDDEEKKLDVAEEGEETTEKVVQKVARTEDTDTAMETLSNDGDGAPLAATQPAEAVESEIGDVRGKGSDQAKPPTMDAESEVFSPTLCGETEDPPIPSSKDTQTSEPLLTPAKEGNCSQQSDRSEPKLIEAGAAVEDQHMKDADEGKHVSLSDDDAKSGIQVPVSSSKGSSNLCETKVDGADRDPREESDDGSETDVSEVLLSEAPIPTAYAEKSNAKSPIDAKKPAMLGDDGSRPHEDSAANGEEEKKDNGNNCEPTSDDGVQSDSTEEKDTMVPNPRKREAESSETVIPATPKRPRTTQKDTEIPASITSSRRRKNLPLSESTPQNHSTRKRGRDNCRTGSPATNDLEQSIRVMTTGVQLSNAQKNVSIRFKIYFKFNERNLCVFHVCLNRVLKSLAVFCSRKSRMPLQPPT